MKKLAFIALTSLFVFGKCKKDSTPTGGNFLPINAQTSWTYAQTGGATGSYTLTVKGTDTVINGRTYKVLTNTAGANNYWAKSGNDYFRTGLLPAGFSASLLEELYLKDNISVNGTWNSSTVVNIPGTGNVNIAMKYTIQELGANRTVASKVYSNVTKVRLDLNATTATLPIPVSIGGGDFYYAEGIGMIQYTLTVNIPMSPTINQGADLTSYVIK
jgi:hypothetical protein